MAEYRAARRRCWIDHFDAARGPSGGIRQLLISNGFGPVPRRLRRGRPRRTPCDALKRRVDHYRLGSRSFGAKSPLGHCLFALAGLGNSNLVPILFSAAGRDPVLGPGPGIATVTTVGFIGFLISGMVVIGLMSKFFGLSVAISLVALLGLIMAVCGPAIIQSHALSRTKV